MTSPFAATAVERHDSFVHFHAAMAPVLTDFIDILGIEPAQEVLHQAGDYLPYVEKALAEMAITDDSDRDWLLIRMMYYIGEYFAQQYGGHWYVDESAGSRFFGRCVVGRFSRFGASPLMIDPLEIASAYVALPCPRPLVALVDEVASALAGAGRQGLH